MASIVGHPSGFGQSAEKMKEIELAIEYLCKDEIQYNSLRAEYQDTHEMFMIAYRRMCHLVVKVNEVVWKKERHDKRSKV